MFQPKKAKCLATRALVLMIVSKYVVLSRIRVPKILEKSASLTGGATLTARNIRAATRVLFSSQKAGGRPGQQRPALAAAAVSVDIFRHQLPALRL